MSVHLSDTRLICSVCDEPTRNYFMSEYGFPICFDCKEDGYFIDEDGCGRIVDMDIPIVYNNMKEISIAGWKIYVRKEDVIKWRAEKEINFLCYIFAIAYIVQSIINLLKHLP